MSYNGGSTLIRTRDDKWAARVSKRMENRIKQSKIKKEEEQKLKDSFVSETFLIKKGSTNETT